jgi:hypothetical protein
MEQLNILADELATIGLELSSPQRLCDFIPASIVELRVKSTTSRYYTTHLRRCRFGGLLLVY